MGFHTFKHKIKLNINQIIALAFFCIIAFGSIMLALPFATKGGCHDSILTPLFTATSAVCVTGLSIVDIWTNYTFGGQLIILLLMEIGGLGFMSVVSILIYVSKHYIDISSLSLMAETIGSDTLGNIARIQKRLILGSLLFESIGAAILSVCFIKTLGFPKALWFGIFHSVSAFCNAGFDLMGFISPGSGMEVFQNNPLVLITISILIVVGGIGFVVWDDIVSSKHIRDGSIYSKLVLITTFTLIAIGFVFFMFSEFNNGCSVGNLTLNNKIVNCLFQSVTTRTAGFASINQASFTDSSKALTIILMIIGGSTGSTAGGIKTVTFIIIISSILSSLFGKKNTIVLGRKLSADQIIHAYTIAGSFVFLSLLGSYVMYITSNVTFFESIFESVSALATVGLSLGITGSLSHISQLVLIILMYIGRVGLLTLTVGFFKAKDNASIKYPSVKLLIG